MDKYIKYISLFSSGLETFLLFFYVRHNSSVIVFKFKYKLFKVFSFFLRIVSGIYSRSYRCLQFEFNPTKQLLKHIFQIIKFPGVVLYRICDFLKLISIVNF